MKPLYLVLVTLILKWYVPAPHFVDALHGILFLFTQLSVDAVLPGATVTVDTTATTPGTKSSYAGLKFSKAKAKEPAAVPMVSF